MDATGKIWVALDCDKSRALEIADTLKDHPAVLGYKVNRLVDQEVFREDGEPHLFEELSRHKRGIFLDLKFHDIPRTVVARTEPYLASGTVYYTVMADGGIEMMMEARKSSLLNPVAVTKLTSLTPEMIELGSGHSATAAVIQLANWAVLAKLGYLVCSGSELQALTQCPWLEDLKYFIPAIRPEWYQKDTPDQKRVMTPVMALKSGATAVIIGSPIVKEDNPLEALEKTVAEIEAA